jgi:putative oxidoreductase
MSAWAEAEARWDRLTQRLGRLELLPLLLLRLFVGGLFLETGWGKVKDIATFTERLAGWGIPFPHFNAYLSGYTELLGGACILVGLGTRLWALPLAFNMLVAVAAVKWANVKGLSDFLELDEPLYGLVFFLFLFTGAGKVSVDALLRRSRTSA